MDDGVYTCPKCHRRGFTWDAKAKILMCCWASCSYVVPVLEHLPPMITRDRHSAEVEKLRAEIVRLHNKIVKLKS